MFSATEILPKLFLASYREVRSPQKIRNLGVTHILNLRESCRFDIAEQFQLLHRPMSDDGDTSLEDVLPECVDYIHDARTHFGGCLVHCHAGVNRSASVVIGYLMMREQLTLREALRHVFLRRREIHPHPNYFAQLQDLDRRLYGEVSLPSDELTTFLLSCEESSQ